MSTAEQLPATLDLHFVRGDDFTRRLFFYRLDEDGVTKNPEDVSSWEIAAQTRHKFNDPTFVEIAIDMSDAVDGFVDITLTADQTADLPRVGVWDLQRIVDETTLTILGGAMNVERDVTRVEGS